MPGKRDTLDLSGIAVTRLDQRGRNPSPKMHAKGDSTGHGHVTLYYGIKQHKDNATR